MVYNYIDSNMPVWGKAPYRSWQTRKFCRIMKLENLNSRTKCFEYW
nr:MAG TPA: hypothetical protein [Caudoviricetes sp.]